MTDSTFEETLTEQLIQKCFEKSGLYPLDREKYPKELFKEDLLAVFNLDKNLTATIAANQRAATRKILFEKVSMCKISVI